MYGDTMSETGKSVEIHHQSLGFGNKGQSILLSHAILVSFSVFLILIVITTFATLRHDFQNFTAANEMDQLCLILKGGAEKVFYDSNYRSPNGTQSRLIINLPDRLADIPYRADFQNNSVFIETLGPKFNTTCKVGFNATYSGFTSGGLTELSFNINTTMRAIGMKNV